MTEKDRLEQAKEMVDDFKQEYKTHHPMFGKEDIETMFWFIEQAKRVQSLEFENHSVMQELNHVDAQNKRYREALNKIITMWISSTDATDDTWLAHEMSEIARKELEQSE